MAYYSIYTYTGTGAPQSLAVPAYLDKSHIHVYLNGVETTSFSWVNSATIQITAGVGVEVLIRRLTSPTARLVNFADGEPLSATDLNTDSTQLFYLAQEALDAYERFDVAASGTPLSAATSAALAQGYATTAQNAANTAVALSTRFRHIEEFGGGDGGVTDNYAAFNAAKAAGVKVLFCTGQEYYFSQGIQIDPDMAVMGAACLPFDAERGTRFRFALATPVCVTMGTNVYLSHGAMMLKNVTITRAAGVIPGGSIGLLIRNQYGTTIEDVACFNHAIATYCGAANPLSGITIMFNRVWTGAVTLGHVVVDTLAEVRFVQCRFGRNGPSDYNCTFFVRITGGDTSNPAGGPNTGVWTHCQFNQGTNTVQYWIEFANMNPGTVGDVTMWQFSDCYVETVAYGIRTDASWNPKGINRLEITNLTFNVVVPFLDLHSGTPVNNWTISNSQFFGSFTMNVTPQINFLQLSNCNFLGAFSLTGPTAGSTAFINGCVFSGGLTLAGTWGGLVVSGSGITGGSYTNTATGYQRIDILPFNAVQQFTPQLRFGTSTTGIVQSFTYGKWQVKDNKVFGTFKIVLTSKGSASGIANITLPGLPDGDAVFVGGGGAMNYAVNMAGLTSPVHLCSGNVGGTNVLNLYHTAATGVSALNETNFTNTSEFWGAFWYHTAVN